VEEVATDPLVRSVEVEEYWSVFICCGELLMAYKFWRLTRVVPSSTLDFDGIALHMCRAWASVIHLVLSLRSEDCLAVVEDWSD
jgi:hypothetical protein